MKAVKLGFVYFIGSKEQGIVKIGYSKNPLQRLKQLQTSSPYFLELFGTVEGDLITEQELQDQFSHYNMVGEWFEYSSELEGFIEHMNEIKPNMVTVSAYQDAVEKKQITYFKEGFWVKLKRFLKVI